MELNANMSAGLGRKMLKSISLDNYTASSNLKLTRNVIGVVAQLGTQSMIFIRAVNEISRNVHNNI